MDCFSRCHYTTLHYVHEIIRHLCFLPSLLGSFLSQQMHILVFTVLVSV